MSQQSEIPSVEFLERNGFSKKAFSDGVFWIREMSEDVFIQLDESRQHITTYKYGWVGVRLTFEDLKEEIRRFDSGDEEAVLWEFA